MDKLLVTPEEAAGLLGIGRTRVYRLMATGELRSVLIGRSRRLPTDGLIEFVVRLKTTAPLCVDEG
jgi:excisionase family DNA binding protein